MFKHSEQFFALPDDSKATVPWSAKNVGWEKNAQIQPSTGTADMKESYQLQFGMYFCAIFGNEWMPTSFKDIVLDFMQRT